MASEIFFKPMQSADEPSIEVQRTIQAHINAVKALSHAIYQSVYIADYHQRAFIYVSDNPLFLCGNSASQVQKMGWLFYFNYVVKEDLNLLKEINDASFLFYRQLPAEERTEYSISYDFRLKQPNNHLLLVNHKIVPFALDSSSNIRLAVCFMSTSSNHEPGNAIVRKINGDKVYRYDILKKAWNLQPNIKLTTTEKEVLLLSSQGFKVDEIAGQLFVSTHAIKFHRGNILKKLHVKNIAEAVACATNCKII